MSVTRQLTALETHPWRCTDMACVIAGPYGGLVGEVVEVSVGEDRKTMLGIRPQGRAVVEVPGEDAIPI